MTQLVLAVDLRWFQNINREVRLASCLHPTDLESIHYRLTDTLAKTFIPLAEVKRLLLVTLLPLSSMDGGL